MAGNPQIKPIDLGCENWQLPSTSTVATITITQPKSWYSFYHPKEGHKELRERLGIDDTALVLQQNRLRWYGHVLRKEDNDWVKKWMKYEVEGARPRRPKRTWREVVKEDCQARKLNTEDAMDRSRWRKLMEDVRWSGWVWVGKCFFWYRPTQVVTDQRPLNSYCCSWWCFDAVGWAAGRASGL